MDDKADLDAVVVDLELVTFTAPPEVLDVDLELVTFYGGARRAGCSHWTGGR